MKQDADAAVAKMQPRMHCVLIITVITEKFHSRRLLLSVPIVMMRKYYKGIAPESGAIPSIPSIPSNTSGVPTIHSLLWTILLDPNNFGPGLKPRPGTGHYPRRTQSP